MKNLDKEKQEELAELEALKEFLDEESYNYVIESLDEDEALFQEYLDDYQQAQSKLFVIDGAEVKFNSHKGKFKVLNDTPSIQGKLVGTIIEKTPLNFTFFDGFQLLSLGEWQDVGTAKFQDRLALIKKSKIQATGQMPGSTTIESGFIEFETSGQVNNPESFDPAGLPMAFYEPEPEITLFQITDQWGNEIEEKDLKPNMIVYLKFEGNIIAGETGDLQLNNTHWDFEYKGEYLENNTLKNYTLKNIFDRIELKVVEPKNNNQ